MRKKILIGIGVGALLIIGGCVTIVGPWPTYSSGFEKAGYFTRAMAAIDRNVQESKLTPTPGPLKAGWARAEITPPVGTPLAGFGDREGKPSTGVHDPLYVTALCLSDGDDTVVLTGSDLLIIPNNVADLVRESVGKQTPLTPNDILFNASHNHSGPGAWGMGYAAEAFGGKYSPAIVQFLADAFSRAIVQAYQGLKPAGLYHGSVDVPEYIRNRTRQAPVDSGLSYLVVQQDDGATCYLASYSAHPTVLGGHNMEFTAEYPGFLRRKIEADTHAFAMYLGGAVGSMGPNAPEGPEGFARAQAMGEALASRILSQPPQPFNKNVDLASIGISIQTPPLQLRLTPSWRLSPYMVNLLGVDGYAWLQAVRVGDLVFLGAPCDLSGEISAELKAWGKQRNLALCNLSFDGDYVGYISPDKYYLNTSDDEKYEMYLMSWCGPHQEAFFTTLMKHMAEVLTPAPGTTAVAAAG